MLTLKSEKVQGKIGYKSIFCYSYFADSPLGICVCIFLRNKYYNGKQRWFKGKRAYFNVTVSKNKIFSAIKYKYFV